MYYVLLYMYYMFDYIGRYMFYYKCTICYIINVLYVLSYMFYNICTICLSYMYYMFYYICTICFIINVLYVL